MENAPEMTHILLLIPMHILILILIVIRCILLRCSDGNMSDCFFKLEPAMIQSRRRLAVPT